MTVLATLLTLGVRSGVMVAESLAILAYMERYYTKVCSRVPSSVTSTHALEFTVLCAGCARYHCCRVTRLPRLGHYG